MRSVISFIFRIFCFFDEGKLIIVANSFKKKTQKTPKKEIEMALAGQSEFHSVYFLPEKAKHSVLNQISNKFKNIEFIEYIIR